MSQLKVFQISLGDFVGATIAADWAIVGLQIALNDRFRYIGLLGFSTRDLGARWLLCIQWKPRRSLDLWLFWIKFNIFGRGFFE